VLLYFCGWGVVSLSRSADTFEIDPAAVRPIPGGCYGNLCTMFNISLLFNGGECTF